MMEANRLFGPSPLSSLGPLRPRCQSLEMMIQDGGLLELSSKATRVPSGKKLVLRIEEMKAPNNVDFVCYRGEDLDCIPNGFVISVLLGDVNCKI